MPAGMRVLPRAGKQFGFRGARIQDSASKRLHAAWANTNWHAEKLRARDTQVRQLTPTSCRHKIVSKGGANRAKTKQIQKTEIQLHSGRAG